MFGIPIIWANFFWSEMSMSMNIWLRSNIDFFSSRFRISNHLSTILIWNIAVGWSLIVLILILVCNHPRCLVLDQPRCSAGTWSSRSYQAEADIPSASRRRSPPRMVNTCVQCFQMATADSPCKWKQTLPQVNIRSQCVQIDPVWCYRLGQVSPARRELVVGEIQLPWKTNLRLS